MKSTAYLKKTGIQANMKLNELIEKALNNVNEDRKAAKELLEGVAEHIGEK